MKSLVACAMLLLVGCLKQTHDAASSISDPTERGLMYIASALVFAAVIRAFFNK